MEAKDRIILAADVSNTKDLLGLVLPLRDHVGMVKIGLQMMHSVGGRQVMEILDSLGIKVFYDCKLHDIPSTVANTSKEIVMSRVHFFNVMAMGDVEMMRGAVVAKGLGGIIGTDPKALAVTVLTSHDEKYCERFGLSVSELVSLLANDAAVAGIDGLICSAQDLETVSSISVCEHMLKVTPGIRPEWAQADDQKRVMTPGDAIRAGADYLVIGRPIRQAEKYGMTPVEAAKSIAKEIEKALGEKDETE